MVKNKQYADENVFDPINVENPFEAIQSDHHVYGNKIICDTDSKGEKEPRPNNPAKIVLDASEGFIPLWAPNMVLRWRFNEASMRFFNNPEAAKRGLREMFSNAVLQWGDASPVRFKEVRDAWDFEIAVRPSNNCSPKGCTLARAFFPDPGRHRLEIFPKMFEQSPKERIDTLIHEIGHIFGLRHFFAQISEQRWPSVIYGHHHPFSIMNYGANSELTEHDRSDLKNLYQKVWSGELRSINGTPVVLMKPFHMSLALAI